MEHFGLTGTEHPYRQDPPDEAMELLILHGHLIEEAVIIFVYGDINLCKAETCTLQTLRPVYAKEYEAS